MPFYTLSALYEKASTNPRGRVLAVVTDTTAAYRKGINKKNTVKIKLIDRSLNESSSISCPKKYCTAFFFSKNTKDLPKLMKIGDILLL